MTIFVHDDVLDNGLAEIKSAATTVILCAGAPADLTEATTAFGTGTGKALADVTVDSDDWTIADASPTGRKITMTAQTGVTVDVTGTADHLAVVDASRLLLVIPLSSSVGVTAANTVGFGAWTFTIPAPVAA